MRKTFKLEGLDCGHCAAAIETEINKLDGVKASVSFMTQKLVLEVPEELSDATVKQIKDVIKKVDRHVALA